jgi:isopenicillin N synthase-like dioxygenase
MLPSEALMKIFRLRADLESRPYSRQATFEELQKAYKDFDESIHNSLLDVIRNSEHDDNHHERLMQPWLDDPEYKKALHQYDHELDQLSKGDKNDH